MRGGIITWTGSGKAARVYVESDHSRADDYYLAEGRGIALMVRAQGDGTLDAGTELDADEYEAWVEHGGGRSTRFAEMTINVPKTLSVAAALSPEISEALDAAQLKVARAMIAHVAEKGGCRVGPRGGQWVMGIDELQAAIIMHGTTRAGDPHRHIHLQFHARVQAKDGRTRGLDLSMTGLFGEQQYLRELGRALISGDENLRAAIENAGWHYDPDTGEVLELVDVAAGLSKRSAQIETMMTGLLAEWRDAHPGREPSTKEHCRLQRYAWEKTRRKKEHLAGGQAAWEARWRGEVQALGGPKSLVTEPPRRVGVSDEVAALATAKWAGLQADRRSGSLISRADLEAAALHVLSVHGTVGDRAAIVGRARHVAVGAMAYLDMPADATGVARTVRCYVTSEKRTLLHELALHAEWCNVQAAHGAERRVRDARLVVGAHVAMNPVDFGLMTAIQRDAAALLVSQYPLAIVQGPAGTGKTTILDLASRALAGMGSRLRVVAPSNAAAQTAAAVTGGEGVSLHRLLYSFGWRWDGQGTTWRRLAPGDDDPATGRPWAGPSRAARAYVGPKDVLVVDEAAMAGLHELHALTGLSREIGFKVALVGDTRQLGPVSLTGAMAQIAAHLDERAQVELSDVHRFVTPDPKTGLDTPDAQYAELSLLLRDASGERAPLVAEALMDTGHTERHDDADALHEAIAERAAGLLTEGRTVVVSVPTNEQADRLSQSIQQRLADAGKIDASSGAVTLGHGDIAQRARAGDLIQTRRNDAELGVANRETWTVVRAHRDGSATLKGGIDHRILRLPAAYLAEHAHLAYATTIHGAQGRTVDHAITILDEMTDRASLYVGATRGRYSNTIHTVGTDRAEVAERLADAIGRHEPETWEAIDAQARRAVSADRRARQAAARAAAQEQLGGLQQPGDWSAPIPPPPPPGHGPIGL